MAKALGEDEFHIGSITIPLAIIIEAGIGSYKNWITLFDHIDDDEYDGQLGINDDEDPRILVNFDLTNS